MAGLKELIHEVHRRSLWQVLAIYGVASWLIYQIVEALTSGLGLPGWLPAFAIVLLLIGLPVVLATAFVQEGISPAARRDPTLMPGSEQELEAGPREVADALRLFSWRNAITGGVLAFALWGVIAAGWVLFGPGESAESASSAADEGRRTVAVLPFANMSGDPESDPFTAGVHDDIITQLSKIAALHVTSRTSVLEYRESPKPIRQVAEELGVATLLAGGVQRAGQRVRINVQLIDAASDRHLWADSYDRDLTAENIFEIQSEIALSVAQALKAELAPGEQARIEAPPTRSIEALDFYHRGFHYTDRRGTIAADSSAVEMFERAVAIDPNFLQAWAELAEARSWLVRSDLEADTIPARRALDRALALDPEDAGTLLASGYYHYYARGDYALARQDFIAALARRPRDAEVLKALAFISRRLGRWDEAIEHMTGGLELDPRSATLLNELGLTYLITRRFAGAEKALNSGLVISPEYSSVQRTEFWLLLWGLGDTIGARRFLESSSGVMEPRLRAGWAGQLGRVRRDYAGVVRDLEGISARESWTSVAFFVSPLWRLGEAHRRLGHLDRAAAYGDSMLEVATRFQPREERVGRDLFGLRAIEHLYRGLALSLRGDYERALRESERAVELYPVSYDALEGAFLLDLVLPIYIAAGEQERTLDAIEELLSIPSLMTLTRLRLDPTFDPLRDHPRFQALLEREG